MGLDCDKETMLKKKQNKKTTMPLLNMFACLMVCPSLTLNFFVRNIVYAWLVYNCEQACSTLSIWASMFHFPKKYS